MIFSMNSSLNMQRAMGYTKGTEMEHYYSFLLRYNIHTYKHSIQGTFKKRTHWWEGPVPRLRKRRLSTSCEVPLVPPSSHYPWSGVTTILTSNHMDVLLSFTSAESYSMALQPLSRNVFVWRFICDTGSVVCHSLSLSSRRVLPWLMGPFHCWWMCW